MDVMWLVHSAWGIVLSRGTLSKPKGIVSKTFYLLSTCAVAEVRRLTGPTSPAGVSGVSLVTLATVIEVDRYSTGRVASPARRLFHVLTTSTSSVFAPGFTVDAMST